MLRPVRRIVTENDKNGKSRVWIDSDDNKTITTLTELWVTNGKPGLNQQRVDMAQTSTGVLPPRGGTVFRYFQLAPESLTAHLSDAERWEESRQWFAGMNATHVLVDTTKHPSMHTTDTTDYIILLSGEVTLVLENEEVELKPFDVVVQRGTNHAWANRGKGDALLMGVLIDESWQRSK
jgi:mannose-6-phosphate isomerase-like protein (cupin superfamily)